MRGRVVIGTAPRSQVSLISHCFHSACNQRENNVTSNIFRVSATHSPGEARGRVGAANRTLTIVFVCLFAFLLVAAPASAAKTHVFLEPFGSAAQPIFGETYSLAVDQSNGDLLVMDSNKLTVSRYKSDGEPDPFAALGSNVIDAKRGVGGKPCTEEPSSCDQTPQNGFQVHGRFPEEEQIAIDESGTATNGDIYITQGYSSTGNLVDIFASDGKYLGQLTAAGGVGFGTTGSFPFSPCGAAVDAAGSLFLGGGYDDKIYKFVSQGAPHNPLVNADIAETFNVGEHVCNLATGAGSTAGSLFANTSSGHTFSVLKLSASGGARQGAVETGNDNLTTSSGVPPTELVTVDPATGHVYTAAHTISLNSSGNPIRYGVINEYDAAGSSPTLLSSFTAVPPVGMAVSASSGQIYITEGGTNASGSTVSMYSPLVTVPDVSTGASMITGDTSVEVEGVVNPDGVALEECRFEYGKSEAPYEHSEACAESPAEIGTSTKTVHLGLNGLAAETLYHYRLVAKNMNATIGGDDETFQTPAKPVVSVWAVGVGTVEATLEGSVDPENAESTYRIEWGPGLPYAHSTATTVVASGRDAETHMVSLPLAGLQPGMVYHYRIVASNDIGVTEGEDHLLRTFALPGSAQTGCPNQDLRTGLSAALPDCRAYEMVSPLEKENGDVLTLIDSDSFPTNLDQSSTEGTGFTYSSYRAFDDPQGAPYTDQYLARRDPAAGWRSEALDPPRGPQSNLNRDLENPYKAFSADLESGWLLQEGEPAPDPCAPSGFPELYSREGAGVFAALSCAPIEHNDIHFMPEIQGFSADGSHAVFRANEALTADASDATDPTVPTEVRGIYQVYESSGAGRLRLVSVLPDGEANATDASAGTVGETNPDSNWNFNRWSGLAHAVSEDGTRVFWSAYGSSGVGPLYLRINADQAQSAFDGEGHCDQPARACTIPVSETVSPEPVSFQAGNPQGTGALFKVVQGPLAGNLYRFDAEAKPPVSQLIAKTVQKNILGASADLSRVYYVSEEATSQQQSEGATQDEPNIYLADEGTTRFIATLSSAGTIESRSDLSNAYGTPIEGIPISHTARVSPDGRSLVFMSNSSGLSEGVAGYDNTDINSGQPDAEVYLYDASADEGKGKLRCVSCDPSGGRPLGRQIGADFSGNGPGYWGAARIPTFETDLYQPRYLTDDGQRVFFDSYSPLVLGDTNSKQDVYQWEAQGSGSCSEGSPSYVPASAGCLSLLSSGQSPVDSEFLDASASGSDAFFTTSEDLLPQDLGLIDVYDARVGGGFPLGPGAPAVCEGEACEGAPVPPLDSTPASFAFNGPGNPISPVLVTSKRVVVKPRLKPCKKGTVRQRGKCVRKKRRSAKKSSARKKARRAVRRTVSHNGRTAR